MNDGTLTYQQDLQLTEPIRQFLKETAKWAKFISIVGFVMVGLMVLLSLFAGAFMSTAMSEEMMGVPGAGVSSVIISIVYLIFALIYAIPIYYLYKFASNMQQALTHNDQDYLYTSFEKLKSHYKFFGVLMAIFLGLYAIMFIVGLLFGGVASLF